MTIDRITNENPGFTPYVKTHSGQTLCVQSFTLSVSQTGTEIPIILKNLIIYRVIRTIFSINKQKIHPSVIGILDRLPRYTPRRQDVFQVTWLLKISLSNSLVRYRLKKLFLIKQRYFTQLTSKYTNIQAHWKLHRDFEF